MISPAQCRAARALLGWSQDRLEAESRVAKKTIADFERGTRGRLQAKSEDAISGALEAAGIELIPQNGGGDGVRFKRPMPRFVRLFRRDDVDHRNWVAFAFDYKDGRKIGFVKYEVLGVSDPAEGDPVSLFDESREAILLCAAEKYDRGDLDPEGRALIGPADLRLPARRG